MNLNAINDKLYEIVSSANSFLSNYILIFLLVGAGIFFTIKTHAVQIRCFGEACKTFFGSFTLHGKDEGGAMSSFQAVATAVAGQVGTGNIVGASGAILIGGPGAIFWMWLVAGLGMATNYAEAVLAQKTRKVNKDGSVSGGAIHYIMDAIHGKTGKFIAAFFAVAIVLSSLFTGSMVQSNAIASTCTTAFGIAPWIVGLIVTVFFGIIFIGGVRRIAQVTEKLVPIFAILYLLGGVVVLCSNLGGAVSAFGLIFECAFNPGAMAGGVAGGFIAALSQGVKRGLFSNEAGMGTTSHAHALANVENPHKQGIIACVSVFIDTMVVVTMTALVVISVLYVGDGALAQSVNGSGIAAMDLANAAGIDKTNMAQLAFGSLFGLQAGSIFVAICLIFFAFSTIIAWNLYAKLNIEWILGKGAVIAYAIVALICIFGGSLLSNDLVWELADFFNWMMVLPNVIGIVAGSKYVAKCAITRGNRRD